MFVLQKGGYAFPNIIREMAIKGDSIPSLANEIGMGRDSLRKRMKGEKSFELPEILAIMDRYNSSFTYLFQFKSSDPHPDQKTA